MKTEKNDKSPWENEKGTWAIGGATMIGVGVGLIFVKTAPILMAASIIIGVGVGLVLSSFISSRS
ncbi:hypothetical protein [Spongiivirga citrea]|uniref:Uncharacterized protein n=1 Tax=Spongiivirga citrea TaxID=1481457 RepID=A0A6M0CE91_9FLAO|nr:hypothetical protein [Spongiivirga citrea]NER15732.1 hypothetical protein [Spongiivirga citrea]